MKTALAIGAAAALLLSASVAQAAAKFFCKRLSGGPVASFVMTIDFEAKDIDVPYATRFSPDPDTVEITATSVQWSFMRGFIKFDRRTGVLDWDTTSDYDYLEAIGQPSDLPEANFKGRMRCRPDSSHTSP